MANRPTPSSTASCPSRGACSAASWSGPCSRTLNSRRPDPGWREDRAMLKGVHSRLGLAARLRLIASALCIPLALALAIHVGEVGRRIGAAQRELDGVRQMEAVWRALAQGGPVPASVGRIGVADPLAALRASPPQGRLDRGLVLLQALADGSGLTLDPDLDTAHLQAVVVAGLPDMLRAATELKAALRLAETQQRVLALDHLAVAAARTSQSLRGVLTNSRDASTRLALADQPRRLTSLVAVARDEAAGLRGVHVRGGAKAREAEIGRAWLAARAELERLLALRVHRLVWGGMAELGAILACLLAGAALVHAIGRGLTRRISGLAAAADDLSRGESEVEIPWLGDSNETGQLARSLSALQTTAAAQAQLYAATEAERVAAVRRGQEAEAASRAQAQAHADAGAAFGRGLADMAQGRLATRIEAAVPAEYAPLKRDFNVMAARLEGALSDAVAIAGALGEGAGQIAEASDHLVRHGRTQVAGLDHTARVLAEVAVTVGAAGDGAGLARAAITSARREAERFGTVIQGAARAMDDIHGSSLKIGEIIKVIDEIAFQTNLLALNAGVEAARAGSAGRGFAIVAQEVRALAQRSTGAAREMKGLVSASAAQVEQGVRLVTEADDVLLGVLGELSEIEGLMGGVCAAVADQSDGLSRADMAIGRMDQLARQGAAVAQRSLDAARKLQDNVPNLLDLTAKFTLASDGRGALNASYAPGPAFAVKP
ncbi:MAG: hypothetical protein B7Y99_04700 [Caulobacterales bacterium 32-69-10]|nr:MAG: hypothetical protein B7Y99_04700 [Caulobacterales bacterium 32-69-10]